VKAFYLLLLFLPATFSVTGQSLNYPQIFGDDWKKAGEFISSNREWMIPLFKKYNVNYNEAVAVIFPELVRYSALRDKMEITLLKTLYINLGKDYSNFSVGHFQMKPYFAEKIRETASELPTRRLRKMVDDSLKYEDIRIYRQAIVKDLEDINSQTYYLILFMKICRDKFRTDSMEVTNRIIFLATAYNTGFYKTEQEIMEMTDKKFFSTKLVAKEHYSYSDISLFWYNHNTK
jgi:hypothetical protein